MRWASYHHQSLLAASTWMLARRDLTGVNAEKSDRTALIERQSGCSSKEHFSGTCLLARAFGVNHPGGPTAPHDFHPSAHPPDVSSAAPS